jgi:hypothetical protein
MRRRSRSREGEGGSLRSGDPSHCWKSLRTTPSAPVPARSPRAGRWWSSAATGPSRMREGGPVRENPSARKGWVFFSWEISASVQSIAPSATPASTGPHSTPTPTSRGRCHLRCATRISHRSTRRSSPSSRRATNSSGSRWPRTNSPRAAPSRPVACADRSRRAASSTPRKSDTSGFTEGI